MNIEEFNRTTKLIDFVITTAESGTGKLEALEMLYFDLCCIRKEDPYFELLADKIYFAKTTITNAINILLSESSYGKTLLFLPLSPGHHQRTLEAIKSIEQNNLSLKLQNPILKKIHDDSRFL